MECWAGGGSGAVGSNAASGGGGGAYSRLNSLAVTAGTSYTVTVGAGGVGLSTSGNGNAGGDSWFSSTGTVLAKGGTGGNAGASATSAAGGAAGSGVGDIKYSGGASGTAGAGGGASGGGGGAGSQGDGVASANAGVSAGTGGVGGGGAYGGAGTAGVVGGSSTGATTCGGASGGAGNGGTGSGGTGGGLVQLTYTATGIPPTNNADLINPFSTTQYSNVSADDGDYFIERGSEYMIQEYKRTWTNNTDKITFTWMGRSTESTLVSPILIQIYNVNSAAWETLAVANTVPADTDFSVTVKQTTNLSNYYDSNNVVTFRSYQQVI